MNKDMSNKPLDFLDSIRNGAMVRQRLQWIEDRLWWVGEIYRPDLVLRFKISAPQATVDFSLYQKLAPFNISYDHRKNMYVCGEKFAPLFPKDHELWLKENASEDSSLQGIHMESVITLKRGINSNLMQTISRATRSFIPLRITYQSENGAEEEVVVCPHAVVETDTRWYLRAWDEKRQRFVDLMPSQILKASEEPTAAWVPQELDEEWNRTVKLVLIPSRKLTESGRRITEGEYQMADGRRILEVRACMARYQLSALNLVDAVLYHEGQPVEGDSAIAVENWIELQPMVLDMN